MTFASEKQPDRIKTPSSKLMILVSPCWKKNFMCNNAHNLFILPLVFLKSLIAGVAFFLGHPVFFTALTKITGLEYFP